MAVSSKNAFSAVTHQLSTGWHSSNRRQLLCNNEQCSTAIVSAVRSLNFVGGRTSTSAALSLLRTDLFTVNSGARANVPHVAVIVTDGLDLDDIQQINSEVFAIVGAQRSICGSVVQSVTCACSFAAITTELQIPIFADLGTCPHLSRRNPAVTLDRAGRV